MGRSNRSNELALALFALGVLLLMPPLLLVLDRPVRIFGIPALYVYLFAVWGLIIGLTAVIAARIEPDEIVPLSDDRQPVEPVREPETARGDA